MAKHKMTEAHYAVLMMVQDGIGTFPPSEEKHHAACLELLGHKFGEPMLTGVNSFSVTGTTKAGDDALAAFLPATQ